MTQTRSSGSVTFCGRGITSKQNIDVEIELKPAGHGLVFEVIQKGASHLIPVHADSVVHTMRNVVLGTSSVRLCLVEHILSAVCFWGLDDLLIRVNGPELPIGDGSAWFWIELFEQAGWVRQVPESTIELAEPVICRKADRLLMAIPDERFSMSYHLDWNHPLIGKRWQTWDPSIDPKEIASARTFGWEKEHEMLGIKDGAVSLTADGFSQPLRFEDEPVRHKLLDLLGDLMLSGVNPINFRARFVSIKAGHEMDVEMAGKLSALLRAHSK